MKSVTLVPSTVIGAGLLAAFAVLLPPDVHPAEAFGNPASGSRDLGLLLITLVGCFVIFTGWPWAILPAAIVGVLGTTALLGDNSVRSILVVHGCFIFTGLLSLVVRRLVLAQPETRARTAADIPMVAVVLVIIAAALYGLILGNSPDQVLISAYHFAVIPLYYFLATHTLTTPARLRAAGVLFVLLSAILTITEMAAPGRHGGAWAVMAAFPLLILSCRTHGWRRASLIALAALYLADVVLASYRTTWTLAAVALLVMVAGGGRSVRRAAGTLTVATITLLVVGLVVSAGIRERASEVVTAVGQGSGYRIPEALVGLRTFVANPLVGSGLGHSTPDVYLPDFDVTTIGPLYHVFYVMILANLGLVGLIALLWPITRALRAGLAERDSLAFAFAALICGFLVAVLFSGPATGHWALGLLPALVLLTKRSGVVAGSIPPPVAEQPALLVEAK